MYIPALIFHQGERETNCLVGITAVYWNHWFFFHSSPWLLPYCTLPSPLASMEQCISSPKSGGRWRSSSYESSLCTAGRCMEWIMALQRVILIPAPGCLLQCPIMMDIVIFSWQKFFGHLFLLMLPLFLVRMDDHNVFLVTRTPTFELLFSWCVSRAAAKLLLHRSAVHISIHPSILP